MPIHTRLALVVIALLALPMSARAQSTDGFHEIHVFPVVVDSTSFSQRFSFRTTQDGSATVSPRYYPAEGTSQATAIDCPAFQVPWGGATFNSLRDLCPSLAAGSQFGFLVLEQTGAQHRPFSGYSRVSNTAGSGFSVEAFPAHTFTSAFSTATGLRRKAASGAAPAFQTNCFIGLMGEHDGPATTSKVLLGLFDESGAQLGDALVYNLLPGQLVRVLDIFAAVGAPAGDYDRASMVSRQVAHFDEERPGIISFCTVQENSNFSADFRIAKQEYGIYASDVPLGPGAYDQHVARVTVTTGNPGLPGQPLPPIGVQPFEITPGSNQQNTHVVFFRHPDWVSCELWDFHTFQRIDPSAGLEMRLLGLNKEGTGYEVLAGGTGITGWNRIYLGDKREHDFGLNQNYLLQVEDNDSGALPTVHYSLKCQSGSGHTAAFMVNYHRAANDF